MLAIFCPRCGRPAPANLAAPDAFHCSACGFSGAPPPAAHAQLHAARSVLLRLDVSLRQLSEAQRRSLERAQRQRRLFVAFSAILFVPFLIWGMGGIGAQLAPQDPTEAFGLGGLVLTLGPLALYVLLSSLSYGQIRGKQRRLEEACAARPPRATGEPVGCHVCGAPLAQRSGQAVVRCAYCQADNLVDPRVLARLSHAETRVAGAIEEEVVQHARAAASEAGFASLRLIPITLAAPFIVLVAIFVVGVPLTMIEEAPNLNFRYVFVPVSGGTCIARLRQHQKKPQLDFGKVPPAGMQEKQSPPQGLSLLPFAVTRLDGSIVRSKAGQPARVVRSFQTVAFTLDNRIEIEPLTGGAHEKREIRGTCLAGDGAPGPKASSAPSER